MLCKKSLRLQIITNTHKIIRCIPFYPSFCVRSAKYYLFKCIMNIQQQERNQQRPRAQGTPVSYFNVAALIHSLALTKASIHGVTSSFFLEAG